MDPLTKLVSGRLKAQPVPGPHPDAELLSAFAENALPEADRAPLLNHLGACSDCRGILFLALPESEEAQKVLIPKASRFRRWGLAWGAAVATVAVAAVFLTTERLEHQNRMAQMAASVSATRPETAADIQAETGTQDKIAAETPPPELDRMQAARDASAGRKAAAAAENEVHPQPEAKHMTGKMQAQLDFDQSGEVHVQSPAQSAGALVGKLRDKEQEGEKDEKQKENSAALGVAMADSGSAGKPKDSVYATTGAAKSRADQPSVTGLRAAVPADAVGTPAPAAPSANVPAPSEVVEVQSAAPFETRSSSSSASLSKVTKLGVTGQNVASVLPKWSLSSAGEVQRSLDRGKTWLPAQPVAGIVFRAVASVGQDVWAAGNGGALYHSPDCGLTWATLTVKEDGKAVQDDFTGIDFSDAVHGRLKTSAGAEFTTSDGGQTWQRK